MDLTSWMVDDSWECFSASCTHSQWHTEGLEALRGKIEVSDMLLLPMWAERTKTQYSMVAYLDDNVSDVLKPALGGGELISDHGCFPWPKKPFLACRPSALLERGSSVNNIFMLDVYERKSDRGSMDTLTEAPAKCVALMRTRLHVLSEYLDNIPLNTIGLVIIFQRKQNGESALKCFEIALPNPGNERRPFQGYLEVLEEKFWNTIGNSYLPAGVPECGRLNAEASDEHRFQKHGRFDYAIGKSVVHCCNCKWYSIYSEKLVAMSDAKGAQKFTVRSTEMGDKSLSLIKPGGEQTFLVSDIRAAMREKMESSAREPCRLIFGACSPNISNRFVWH